jgi:hypothetical protein
MSREPGFSFLSSLSRKTGTDKTSSTIEIIGLSFLAVEFPVDEISFNKITEVFIDNSVSE